MERLVDWCQRDEDVRWLIVGCSVARGAADALSDLDMALGVREEHFDEALQHAIATVSTRGDLVDVFVHELPVCFRHRRIFAPRPGKPFSG